MPGSEPSRKAESVPAAGGIGPDASKDLSGQGSGAVRAVASWSIKATGTDDLRASAVRSPWQGRAIAGGAFWLGRRSKPLNKSTTPYPTFPSEIGEFSEPPKGEFFLLPLCLVAFIN